MGFMIGPMVFQRGLKKPMWGLVCKDASSLCIEAGLVVIVAPLIPLNIGCGILDFLKAAHHILMSALWPHYEHMVPTRGAIEIS